MKQTARLAVIIPALDEAATVQSVVTRARSIAGCHVFVVDDGSTDSTASIARRAGATVLSMPYTAGAWNSVQAAMLYALRHGDYDFFATMDADGQHLPEQIPFLVEHACRRAADVVIGSCPGRGSTARRLAWSLFAATTRLGVSDMTSGLRVYSPRAVKALLSREAALLDYQDLGVLLLLRRYGFRCAEVDVSMTLRADGCSRIFNSWWAVVSYMVKTCLWILFDRIQPKAMLHPALWKDYDSV